MCSSDLAVGPLVDRLKSAFIRQFAAKGSASVIGKALPFGIGAAVGGTGNHLLGRRVVVGSRRAFGVAPLQYPAELEPRPGATRVERTAVGLVRRTGSAIGVRGRSAAATVAGLIPRRNTHRSPTAPGEDAATHETE